MQKVRKLVSLALLGSMLFLSACSTVSYYSQAIGGHLSLMRARESIDKLLASEDTDPELRAKLETLVRARAFAVERLTLPDNDSYSTYVETGRDYVTWNVVAADEFSLQARRWCFPIAGCVNYRGYFAEQDAIDYAEALKQEQLDVTIGGASAYSTLGWFDDPVLDTMLNGGEIRYVGTLFHELAHQHLYVKDDSNFNEAFASFVEQAGIRLWLQENGRAEHIQRYNAALKRSEEFLALLKQTREELMELYALQLEADAMRERKQAVFTHMRERYQALRSSWADYPGYDGWFARELNNARLVSVATYRRYVPAFEAMYREAGEDLQAFFLLAGEVAEMPMAERRAHMESYL